MFAIVIATVCLTINHSQAQYYTTPFGTGNPGDKNTEDLEYPVGGGLPNTWNVIHAGGVTNPVWSAIENLPFSFVFNGDSVNSFKVSTSGVLTFSTAATTVPTSLNSSLPHASIPNNSICIWGLSGKGSNDKIVSKTFGNAPYRQYWISFNDYSKQAIFSSHYTYWSIVLEESTNNIYIIDQRTSAGLATTLTLGIQLSNSSAISIAGSPQINSASSGDPSRSDNRYYTFMPGTQPNRDIEGVKILMSDIIAINQGPFTVKFVCQNVGSDTIHSLDLNYLNSSNVKTTAAISGLTILPWQSDTIEHTQTWVPTPGVTVLKVWAGNINNSTDENPLNDTVFHALTIIQQSALRVPFLESFTSSTSPGSSSFNTQIENTLASQTSPAVHLKYVMNWPGTGDPYYTSEAGVRRQFYSISTIPYLQLDGNDWSNFNYTINTSAVANARSQMALVSLDAGFYVNGKTVCADITIDPLVSIANPNLKLYVAIYEKQTINNAKSNGESKFYHVMKKMLPGGAGTAVASLSAGTAQLSSFCYTFNGTYILPQNATQPVNLSTNHTVEDFSDLGVAVWLQDDVTKEVLQATEAYNTIGTGENLEALHNLKVFPNPTSSEVFVSLSVQGQQDLHVSLISITGQHLLQKTFTKLSGDVLLPVALPQLSAGIYILNVRVGDNLTSQKLIIE